MRALSAKVCESFSSSTTCCCSFLAGAAKGFAPAAGWAEVEKGFEKGFAVWLDFEGWTPKRDSPMLVCCLSVGSSAGGAWGLVSVVVAPAAADPSSTFEMRVVLRLRTEPSFLRQAFCLHPNKYTLLSWPGNLSGRSALSCSSRLRSPLQTLHLARAPDGMAESSSQDCESWFCQSILVNYACGE